MPPYISLLWKMKPRLLDRLTTVSRLTLSRLRFNVSRRLSVVSMFWYVSGVVGFAAYSQCKE